MKLIMLSGVGATGKTTVANRLKEIDSNVVILESPVRRTYASMNLNMETDMLSMPIEMQFQLQDAIFDAYCNSLFQACFDYVGTEKIVIAERSPIDYIAYQLYIFAGHLSLEKLKEQQTKKHQKVLAKLSALFPEIATHIVAFPFPAPFTKETTSSDGWRSDTLGKNYLWSCVLEVENIRCIGNGNRTSFDCLWETSVDDRVEAIRKIYLPFNDDDEDEGDTP